MHLTRPGGAHGPMNGQTLEVDPKTGYLEPGSGWKISGFNGDKKARFVDLARQFWPNIARICEGVGINRATFSNHYELDPKFKADVDEAKEQALDALEQVMRERGQTPGGFMDRIAMLKAYRGERWNLDRKLEPTSPVHVTISLAERARQYNGPVIEAQVENNASSRAVAPDTQSQANIDKSR